MQGTKQQPNQQLQEKIRITFDKQNKTFSRPNSYVELVKIAQQAFGNLDIPNTFKFFYSDEEGDIISITCQEDFEGAFEMENNDLLVLVLERTSQNAKFIFPLTKDFSNSQEQCFGESAQSVVFEEVLAESVKNDEKDFTLPSNELTNLLMKGNDKLQANQVDGSWQESMRENKSTEVKVIQMLLDSVKQSQQEQMPMLPCFECEGKKFILSRPCIKCFGRGTVSKEFNDRVAFALKGMMKQIVREEILEVEAEFMNKSVPQSISIAPINIVEQKFEQIDLKVEEQKFEELQHSNLEIKQEQEKQQISSSNENKNIVGNDEKEENPKGEEQSSLLQNNQVAFIPDLSIAVSQIEENLDNKQLIEDQNQAMSVLKQSELPDEIMRKISYMENMDKAQIQNQQLINKHRELVEMGYLNFQANHQLLVRTNGNISNVVDALINQRVSESMFVNNQLQ